MRVKVLAILCAAWAPACSGAAGDDGVLTIQTVSEYNPEIPVAGVQVQVDDLPWVTTDANGMAEFAAVVPPYTVRVYQSDIGPVSGTRFDDVWELPGQSADPLVLEVDGSFVEGVRREVVISGEMVGLTGDPAARTVLHAFEVDAAEPPTRYFGHASAAITMDAPVLSEPGSPGSLTGVILALQAVTEARVTGQTTVPAVLASGPKKVPAAW